MRRPIFRFAAAALLLALLMAAAVPTAQAAHTALRARQEPKENKEESQHRVRQLTATEVTALVEARRRASPGAWSQPRNGSVGRVGWRYMAPLQADPPTLLSSFHTHPYSDPISRQPIRLPRSRTSG